MRTLIKLVGQWVLDKRDTGGQRFHVTRFFGDHIVVACQHHGSRCTATNYTAMNYSGDGDYFLWDFDVFKTTVVATIRKIL